MSERFLHCWKGKSDLLDEQGKFGTPEWAEAILEDGTCLLEAGHEGPHVFWPDSEIGVTFEPEDAP